MEDKDEDSSSEVIRFSVRWRLTQAAVCVDKNQPIKEISSLIADTIGNVRMILLRIALASLLSARACRYNDGQPKSGFVLSQDLIRTLTKGE